MVRALARAGARRADARRRSRTTGVTYAAKIDKAETRIDWTKPWQAVHDHIRGLSPFPGAWFEIGEGAGASRCCARPRGEGSGAPGTVLDDRLTIACGDGAVRLLELQRAGKQAMTADEFLRGTPVAAGHQARLTRMPRYKLTIEYDGTPFVGWQIQDERPVGAGRADGRRSRRSAARRVARPGRRPHRRRRACARPGRACRSRQGLATPTRCATRSTRICGRIRSRCWRPSVVAGRFRRPLLGARSGTISTASSTAAPISRSSAAAPGACRGRSTPRAMHAAAQRLVGQHDFTTFRAAECQAKSPVKTLDRLDVERDGDEIRVNASARSFLHHQVRSMVGSLVQVGEGKWSADDLAARARRARPHRLRPGRAAGRALSGAGGLLTASRRSAEIALQDRADRSPSARRGLRPARARRSRAWSGRPGRTRPPGNSP